jgi:hypothetical protein
MWTCYQVCSKCRCIVWYPFKHACREALDWPLDRPHTATASWCYFIIIIVINNLLDHSCARFWSRRQIPSELAWLEIEYNFSDSKLVIACRHCVTIFYGLLLVWSRCEVSARDLRRRASLSATPKAPDQSVPDSIKIGRVRLAVVYRTPLCRVDNVLSALSPVGKRFQIQRKSLFSRPKKCQSFIDNG